MTAETAAELARLRENGLEINEIAEQSGLSRNTVMRQLQKVGPKQRWPGRTLSPEHLEEAGQLYASGLSAIVVAERFGVDRRYLRRVLPGAGFPLRPPGRQKAQSSD